MLVWLEAWDSIRVYQNSIKVSKITQTQIFIHIIL